MVAPYSGAMLAIGRPVGHGSGPRRRTEELDEAADHPDAAQQVGDGQHQVGGAVAPGGSPPVSRTPTTWGTSMK